jgi:hypothetical protein
VLLEVVVVTGQPQVVMTLPFESRNA